MISEFPWDAKYRISNVEAILTPALALYPDVISSNIGRTLELLGGDANRWRVHIKTAKLAYTLRMLIKRGIRHFKCATTLELLLACQNGAADVLVAYPSMGANARRIREIADEFPRTRISVLAENESQVQQWPGSRVGIFLDINPGMNRTGIELQPDDRVFQSIREIQNAGLEFRGLHYYDGQYGGVEEPERTRLAHAGYGCLLELVAKISKGGCEVPEVITAGTPSLPASLSFEALRKGQFIHRVSPGTVVYHDATSLAQLPESYGYAPAALILTRVVSRPHEGMITCDAGHKSVSADAGVPTCVVAGHPELTPLSPSEEHLPMKVSGPASPKIGDVLYLIPRHVCPTVNNFDLALLVKDGEVESIEEVSARGREGPLLKQRSAAEEKNPAAVEAS
jgi:D-serine deaminase-like pyridoxal phosphate-dependent protein